MRCSAVLFALALSGLLVLSSCVSQSPGPSAHWHGRSDAPAAPLTQTPQAQTQTADRIPFSPDVLDGSPGQLAYAAAVPPPSRTITVRPAPPPFPLAPPQQHIVAPGETLYAIARRRLGDEERWRDIMDANPGLRPSELKAGQPLNMPR